MKIPEYIIGITGASGSILGIALVEELLKKKITTGVIVTSSGRKTAAHEVLHDRKSDVNLRDILKDRMGEELLHYLVEYDNSDYFTPPASGSSSWKGIAVVPASMKTISSVATGYSDSLLTRSVDVSLKEKRKTVLVPRESPVHALHLKNMMTCAELGASIVLPVPAFYSFPESIDQVVAHTVGRVLVHLGVETDLVEEWNHDEERN
jgi:flavin prenyltransferase